MADSTPTPPATVGLLAATPTIVALRHPATRGGFWVLAAAYLAGMALASVGLAVLALLLLPLGVAASNPRRALWLWAAGLIGSLSAMSGARDRVAAMGGLEAAFQANAWLAGGLVGMMVVALVVLAWHVTWVASERNPR